MSKAPTIKPIPDLALPPFEQFTLSNGVPVYTYSAGTQEVLKIECIFRAGKSYENQHLVAKTTAALLSEGTIDYTSAQLSEKIDFYGAVLSCRGGIDTAQIRLFCMNKQLENLLPYLYQVIHHPSFPQEELDIYLENMTEKLSLSMSKNETLGYRKLTESLFGAEHPYGYNMQQRDLEKLSIDLLLDHHTLNYSTKNMVIFVSGKLKPNSISLIDKYLGQYQNKNQTQEKEYTIAPTSKRKIHIVGPQKHQAAIRIGCPLFDRKHPDFPGMYVMNTLLGGYFGSRLMANLREDKGYTYGIYSSVDTFKREGCFYISTEVGSEKTQKSLDEIYYEIGRLQTTEATPEELKMVQNYLMGFLMSQMDGPFNNMDIIKSLLLEVGDVSYFHQLIQKIKTTTPREIKRLAQKYLQKEDLIEIVVSAKESS